MNQLAISVEGLGKEYAIGKREKANETFREMLTGSLSATLDRFQKLSGKIALEERFWALKEVSFHVNEGEVVGIIGGNGAGKSTLLKILSRITDPSEGRIAIRGRVASLLEVGTGFHPELTGRENIYLNGAILGMSRAEISKKFDKIVAFAEVERFLDTPVKRYSSGMHVRLAFAVAAHLDSDVLLVDEVLAVGDAEFQERCLGKMQSVAKEGRTVLFISHNMNAVKRLCSRAILIEKGRIVNDCGNINRLIDVYLRCRSHDAMQWENLEGLYSQAPVVPLQMFIGDESGNLIEHSIANDDGAYVYIKVQINEIAPDLEIGYTLYTASNEPLYTSYHIDACGGRFEGIGEGEKYFRSMLPQRVLNEGKYYLDFQASFFCREWIIEPGFGTPRISFMIRGGLSDSPMWVAPREGLLAPVLSWEIFSKRANAK